MKRAVLHVGSGKTGSTSIQAALSRAASAGGAGFSFPSVLGYRNNQALRFAFCDVDATPSNIRRRYGRDPAGYAQFQNEIRRTFVAGLDPAKDLIVSSEFMFLSSVEETQRIASFLAENGFEKVHVVMYLRDPAGYYLSAAQQNLKNTHVLPKPADFNYNMLAALDAWQSISPESLVVREFDRKLLASGDVVVDFSQQLREIGVQIALPSVEASNESMSVEAAVCMQEAQYVVHNSGLSAEALEALLRCIRRYSASDIAKRGTRPVLKKEVAAFLHHRFWAEIEIIQRRYGVFTAKTCPTPGAERAPQVSSFLDICEGMSVAKYLELRSLGFGCVEQALES